MTLTEKIITGWKLKRAPIAFITKGFRLSLAIVFLVLVLLPKVNLLNTFAKQVTNDFGSSVASNLIPETQAQSFSFSNYKSKESKFESLISLFEIEENEDNSSGKKIIATDLVSPCISAILPLNCPSDNYSKLQGHFGTSLFAGQEHIIGFCSFRI